MLDNLTFQGEPGYTCDSQDAASILRWSLRLSGREKDGDSARVLERTLASTLPSLLYAVLTGRALTLLIFVDKLRRPRADCVWLGCVVHNK
jgi:hypothetical protein